MRLARATLLAPALIAAGALGLLASGCAGSSSEGVAQVETTTTTSGASTTPSGSDDPAAYSACMRENGVTYFPDPGANGNFNGVPKDRLGNDPQFPRAHEKCRRLLPNGGVPTAQEQAERLRVWLAYAACMRENGVPKFPDPRRSDDGIDLQLGPGVDPGSPQFKAAKDACKQLTPSGEGLTTRGGQGQPRVERPAPRGADKKRSKP